MFFTDYFFSARWEEFGRLPLSAAIFGAALLTRFFINLSRRRQDELLNYPLTGGQGLTPAGTVYVAQAVWNYLEERMLI